VSEQNVAIVRDAYERFRATGELVAELAAPGFVWDMSNFHGWPEEQVYEGVEGAEAFLREWTEAWDDWELQLEALRDAGEKVVAILRQRGRSRQSGLPVDMFFAQVWTLRDGLETRMDMYSDPAEALQVVGLEA
jgi:ketosteroid isomerase-like protein